MSKRHSIPENSSWRVKPQRNSTSKLLGVSFHKPSGRWQAQMTVDSRSRHLGYYDTPQAAHAAYLAAKRQLHPGFLR